MNILFTSRRMNPPEAIKQRIRVVQKNRCALCNDALSECEFDHISPLCLGGTNDSSNLRALCHECHSAETDKLLNAECDFTHTHN